MKFLTGKELSESIYDIIYDAKKYLIILSPYIQLGEYFRSTVFNTLVNNSAVHIIIGFGKNVDNKYKSFKKEDFDYFIQFPNITIVYIPNLHAKYYGNECKSVITSLNLIDYSFANNIEFGVYSKKGFVSINNNSFFQSTKKRCLEIVETEGFTVFAKRPKFEKRSLLGNHYLGSDTDLNLISELVNNIEISKINISKFSKEKYVNSNFSKKRVSREIHLQEYLSKDIETGHCIRCCKDILLDIEKPLCRKCFREWSRYRNKNYREKYCISCGNEKETSFSKPACNPCFKKMKQY